MDIRGIVAFTLPKYGKTNYRTYLREAKVPLKKYFYVLRPLLSVRWLNGIRHLRQ